MNKIRFEKRGELYIETYDIDGNVDSVINVKNPFKDTIPKEVELKKVGKEYYIKGYEPVSRRKVTKET